MELTLSELAVQQAELLPERETLFFDFNVQTSTPRTRRTQSTRRRSSRARTPTPYQKIFVSQH